MDNRIPDLLSALSTLAGCSLDAKPPTSEEIKFAESKLEALQSAVPNRTQFCAELLRIALGNGSNLPEPVRCLAAIRLKTCLELAWRRRLRSGDLNEELRCERDLRIDIRNQLLSVWSSGVSVTSPTSKQLVQAVAKLARYDWPDEWPALLPTLGNCIVSGQCTAPSLFCLQHVVKALASRRLSSDRQSFEQMAASIFPTLFNLLRTVYTSAYSLQLVQQPEQFEIVFRLYKILHYLLQFGYNRDTIACEPDNCFDTFVGYSVDQLAFFVTNHGRPLISPVLAKLANRIVKCLAAFFDNHALAFGPFVPKLMATTAEPFLVTSTTYNGYDCELFSVRLLNFLRLVVRCREYECESGNSEAADPRSAIASFFGRPGVLGVILDKFVLDNGFIQLGTNELDVWNSEPEEYVVCSLPAEDYEHCLRIAAELFLVAMFVEYDDVFPGLLAQRLAQSTGLSVLAADALYNVFGQVAPQFGADVMDCNQLVLQVIVPTLQSPGQSQALLLWRLVWLLGRLRDLDPPLSNIASSATIDCLATVASSNLNFPLAVRLQAIQSIRVHIDSAQGVSQELMAKHLGKIVQACTEQLASLSTTEGLLAVLGCLSSVTDVAPGVELQPHLEGLQRALAVAWHADVSHELLRGAVVNNLSSLVSSLSQGDQPLLRPVVLEIVQGGVVDCASTRTTLLDDIIDLWLAAVNNGDVSIDPSAFSLFDLFPRLLMLIAKGHVDSLQSLLDLLESYYLLAPERFISLVVTSSLSEQICALLASVAYESVISIVKFLDIVVVTAGASGALFYGPILNNLLQRVLSRSDSNAICAAYLATLSRFAIAVQPTELLLAFLSEFAHSHAITQGVLVDRLSELWLERLSSASSPLDRRKLMAMMLARLLPNNSSQFLFEKFGSIASILIDVLEDLSARNSGLDGESNATTPFVDIFAASLPDSAPPDARPHVRRKKDAIRRFDPVYSQCFAAFIRDRFRELQILLGPAFEQLVASTTDQEVVRQLRRHL